MVICKLHQTCERKCKAKKAHKEWEPCPWGVDSRYAKPIAYQLTVCHKVVGVPKPKSIIAMTGA
jgi:hypothetical protein